jgi:hypothetical protein
VSLTRNALLDARLLSAASAATSAAAATLAQGVFSFVEEVGHVCDVSSVVICFDVVGDWMVRIKLRGGEEQLVYMPWSCGLT